MRTLIWAMPSSGASFVAWHYAVPGTIGLLDMCRGKLPDLSEWKRSVVMKDTCGSFRPLDYLLREFRPHRTVLVLRDEKANRASMIRRFSASIGGRRFLPGGIARIGAMFRRFDRECKRHAFDETVHYEDFIKRGTPKRSLMEILLFNHEQCRWCRTNSLPQRWSTGGIRVPEWDGRAGRVVFRTIRYYGAVVVDRRTKHGIRIFYTQDMTRSAARRRMKTGDYSGLSPWVWSWDRPEGW